MTPTHLLLGGTPSALAPQLLAHGAALAGRPLTPAEGAELAAALLAFAAEVRRLSAGWEEVRAGPTERADVAPLVGRGWEASRG